MYFPSSSSLNQYVGLIYKINEYQALFDHSTWSQSCTAARTKKTKADE